MEPMNTLNRLLISALIAGAATVGFELWQDQGMPLPTGKKLVPAMASKAFGQLPGWSEADLRPSLEAFQNSCQLFLKLNPEKSVGSSYISLKAKQWQPACRAAFKVDVNSPGEIKNFFQAWFKPTLVSDSGSKQGLFTGYYAPSLKGSRDRSSAYSIPIYDAESKSKVLAWVSSEKDRTTLRIEGSAVIIMDNGDHMPVEYIRGSGANLYFKETADHAFHGAQDIKLTAGYSMAIDREWIPLGAPLWVNTSAQLKPNEKTKAFQRLMVAQDVGSAIRGAVRGDLYWGEGQEATNLGKNVRAKGQYWILLPKQTASYA